VTHQTYNLRVESDGRLLDQGLSVQLSVNVNYLFSSLVRVALSARRSDTMEIAETLNSLEVAFNLNTTDHISLSVELNFLVLLLF